ncbi:tyrosyl-DNA phosphodiesterase 1-like isoform X3 [Miscanthus floridulus]|uniref:tyrosyl-DNA phosphodiesterase 1-like isoform X3 n=1 Tax=Miscanthus floridulus TaxID=154761 RepID=UPI00345797F5
MEDEALARTLQGEVLLAVLSNYMVDIDWLRTACPSLRKVPHVLVLHGQDGASLELFGLPHIRLVRLLFSVGTVFFSHNNSAGTVFFSQFQPSFRPANGAIKKLKPANWILHKPPLQISFGTHHSKAMLLVYP